MERLLGMEMETNRISECVALGEWGNGDFFGPLVASALYVNEENDLLLQSLGLDNCRRFSNDDVLRLASLIKKNSTYSVVPLEPKNYNDLYTLIGSQSRILALAHARAIERVLERGSRTLVFAGQIVDEVLLNSTLLEKGIWINLKRGHESMEKVAVAAASILAHAEYIRWIIEYSEKSGFYLPKGANSHSVIDKGISTIAHFGYARLQELAKLHFKTFREIQRNYEDWDYGL